MEKRRILRQNFAEKGLVKKYKKAECKDCSVHLTKMDLGELKNNLNHTPKMGRDAERVSPDSAASRLRRNENGMVLLPRTFYNKHPAKTIITTRRSSGKLLPAVSPKEKSSKKSGLHSKATAKNQPVKLNNNGLKPLKKSEILTKKEYKLVFVNPVNDSSKTHPDNGVSLTKLSDLISTDCLPSNLWEIERIPPLMSLHQKSDGSYDTIAAELEALMGESKRAETPEKMDVDPDPCSVDGKAEETKNDKNESPTKEKGKLCVPEDSEMTAPIPEATEKDEISTEPEKVQEEFPSIMDILNEQPICDLVDNKMQIDIPVATPEPIAIVTCQEKAEEIIAKASEKMSEELLEKTLKDIPETLPKVVAEEAVKENLDAAVQEASEAATEEASTAAPELVPEIPPDVTTEEIPISSNLTPDASVEPSKIKDVLTEPQNDIEESKKEVKVLPDLSNDDTSLKSVIFRRLTADKQTYDRSVTFQFNLEYSVAINDKKVDLLGAPEFITSVEDLQILLQIVDDVSLDSFIITYKS